MDDVFSAVMDALKIAQEEFTEEFPGTELSFEFTVLKAGELEYHSKDLKQIIEATRTFFKDKEETDGKVQSKDSAEEE